MVPFQIGFASNIGDYPPKSLRLQRSTYSLEMDGTLLIFRNSHTKCNEAYEPDQTLLVPMDRTVEEYQND